MLKERVKAKEENEVKEKGKCDVKLTEMVRKEE